MGTITMNVNTSALTGADTQLGIVPNQLIPVVITALRDEIWLLRLCAKDLSNEIAQKGDTITWEKVTGTLNVVDFTTDAVLTFQNYTVTTDYAQLDRWIGIPYTVKELSQLLPHNPQGKWNAFRENVVKVLAEYIEDDLLGLYASMSYSHDCNGPLGRTQYPTIKRKAKQNSKSRGPWYLLISDYDAEALQDDTNLLNYGFSQNTTMLQKGVLFSPLYNIITIDHSMIPYTSISSPGTYTRQYNNILFQQEAIQFFSRSLGIPKQMNNIANPMFVTVTDQASGLSFRMRIYYNHQRTQPRYEIVLEVLYGIKLYKDELAMVVNTQHTV